MAAADVLSIHDLSIDFQTPRGLVHALRGVSLAVPRGSIVGIVGESGSGKSTLSLAAMGLLPENAVIAVNEILCADPACPGTETVILVMKPGEKTRAFKVQMGLAELTPQALAQALSGQAA